MFDDDDDTCMIPYDTFVCGRVMTSSMPCHDGICIGVPISYTFLVPYSLFWTFIDAALAFNSSLDWAAGSSVVEHG